MIIHSIGQGGQQKLLAKAMLVQVPSSRGRIGWDSATSSTTVYNQRKAKLCFEFPDIYLRTSKRSTLYRTYGVSSVVCNEFSEPLLAHSLIFELYRNIPNTLSLLGSDLAKHLAKSKNHPVISIDEQICLPLCNEGSGTWGHWVGHNLPRALMFAELCPDGLIIIPKSYLGSFSSFGQLLMKYIPKERLFLAPDNAVIKIKDCASIDLPYQDGVFHPLLAEHIMRLSITANNASNSRKYVRRSGPRRSVVNNREFEDLLKSFTFEPTTIDVGCLDSQIKSWSSCKVMMSILGSDMVNMALTRPEEVCAITPHWFGDIFFYGLASVLGIEWHEYYGGLIVEEKTPIHASSFKIDINDMQRFLEYAIGR